MGRLRSRNAAAPIGSSNIFRPTAPGRSRCGGAVTLPSNRMLIGETSKEENEKSRDPGPYGYPCGRRLAAILLGQASANAAGAFSPQTDRISSTRTRGYERLPGCLNICPGAERLYLSRRNPSGLLPAWLPRDQKARCCPREWSLSRDGTQGPFHQGNAARLRRGCARSLPTSQTGPQSSGVVR